MDRLREVGRKLATAKRRYESDPLHGYLRVEYQMAAVQRAARWARNQGAPGRRPPRHILEKAEMAGMAK